MAREKVDNKLNVVIGTKAQIEGDTSIPENSIIVVTDEELKADDIVYSVEKNVKEAIEDLEVTIGDIDSDVFFATFGTTTFAEITQALADGKLPIAISGTFYYTFVNSPAGNPTYYFQNVWLGTLKNVFVNDSDVWANRDISLEPATNKVQTISDSSTNTQFPSAKAVWDLVDASGGGGGSALYAVNILKPSLEGTDKHAYYSIDDGVTWIELSNDMDEGITINASQIKLKVSTTVIPMSSLQVILGANYRAKSVWDNAGMAQISRPAGEDISLNHVLTAEEQPYIIEAFCDGDD